jgi:hypothetical protein
MDWAKEIFVFIIGVLATVLIVGVISRGIEIFVETIKETKAQKTGIDQSSHNKRYLLILFFPVTIYLFVGTLLLFLLFKFEQIIEVFADYSQWPGIDSYIPTEWHSKNIWLSILFPIVWPTLFIWDLLVFIYAIFASLVNFISDAITYIWKQLVKAMRAIWEWTIESVLYIWEQIKIYFS